MHGDGIGGSEQAQRAPHHRSVGHGVAWRWNGASSVPWEWRRGSRARVGGLIWRGRPGSSGAARSSARGVAWGPRTRVRRWRRPTSGGVGDGVLGVAGRVAWAQGEKNRRRTQGRRWQWYIYATPLYSRCVLYLYSRLVTCTGSKGFFGGPRNCSPPLTLGGLPTRE